MSLHSFVEYFWTVLEPETPFVDGWSLHAICNHLEAVERGEVTKLLMNVPPGFMKSLLTNVFFPAWIWSAKGKAGRRFISFSYAAHLTRRDNRRLSDLLNSWQFKEIWGSKLTLIKDGEELISNTATGWKLASSVGGVGTGERGDYILLDDPHNVHESESDAVRTSTVRWFRESMSNRLNNMQTGVVIVIMQRVHEDDVAGNIIDDEEGLDYTHLRIPMQYESNSEWSTENEYWKDPRTYDGELAWPERFASQGLRQFQKLPFMWACQYQQNPEPRGGAIIMRDWWRVWDPPGSAIECPLCHSRKSERVPKYASVFKCLDCATLFRGLPGKFPPCSFIIASVDSAYTEKERNDPTACTVWGIFKHPETKEMGVILMDAWAKWVGIRGQNLPKLSGETDLQHRDRCSHQWGLVEWTWHTCRRFKVDLLLIESKASGITLEQELALEHEHELWATEMVNPAGDKESRAHSVVGVFAQGLVWAPVRDWSKEVIDQCAKFPFAAHDDLVDSTTMALRKLRDMGLLQFENERAAEEREAMRAEPVRQALYPV